MQHKKLALDSSYNEEKLDRELIKLETQIHEIGDI
jgi:hypothetical protein